MRNIIPVLHEGSVSLLKGCSCLCITVQLPSITYSCSPLHSCSTGHGSTDYGVMKRMQGWPVAMPTAWCPEGVFRASYTLRF